MHYSDHNRSRSVAALFVLPDTIYSSYADIDLWPETRDARLYSGSSAVIAHPPCARWCLLAKFVQKVYGHKIGDDGGCFLSALNTVRMNGGVLEHPAYSLAWSRYNLTRPVAGAWTHTHSPFEWVTQVSQCAYGHVARKRTWLLYKGYAAPPELDWSEPAPKKFVSSCTASAGRKNLGRTTRKEALSTPRAFADVLVSLARNAQ